MWRRESEDYLGNQRPRPSQSPLRRQAIRHDDRVHGSHSRSRWSHHSPSGSTYQRPRATTLEAVVKATQLFIPIAAVNTAQLVLPRTFILDLALRVFRDQALVLSAAMACDPGVAIATAPGMATGLTEATVHALK